MESKNYIATTYKVDDENAVDRQFFVKQHMGNNDQKPSERTLLIMNVPPFVNDKSIKFLYEHCGGIECIYFHKKPKSGVDDIEESSLFSKKETIIGYKCAYVVFKKTSGLKKALKSRELAVLPVDKLDRVGVDKYVNDYTSSFIDVDRVKKEVEEYMKYYDQTVEEEKQKSKEATVDEDGWITVTKHSKKPKIPRKEGVSQRIIEKQKKAAEKRTLLNFYRCQLKQQKEEKLLELQKKFEKDKKRIALMRANRKFRPF